MATTTSENNINAGMGGGVEIKMDSNTKEINSVVDASINVIRNSPMTLPMADKSTLP